MRKPNGTPIINQDDMNAYRYWLGIASILLLIMILGTVGITWLLN